MSLRKIIKLFALVTVLQANAGNDPIDCSCVWEKPKKQEYAVDFGEKMNELSEEVASSLASTIALDIVWGKKLIKQAAPHLTSVEVDEAFELLTEKFGDWLKDSGGKEILQLLQTNASIKLKKLIDDSTHEVQAEGVYTALESDFLKGTWDGLDLNIEGDSGSTTTFTVEVEFNAGFAVIQSTELKFQLKVSSDIGYQMLSITSVTKSSSSTIASLSGKPKGRVSMGGSIELQAGVSVATVNKKTKDFTNPSREAVVLTAKKDEAACTEIPPAP